MRYKVCFKDEFTSGYKEGICHRLYTLYFIVDKFKKQIYFSEVYHRSGNLCFRLRGYLHENLRQSYVYNV